MRSQVELRWRRSGLKRKGGARLTFSLVELECPTITRRTTQHQPSIVNGDAIVRII